MMPSQSWKNLDPETGVHWDADESDWQRIRDHWPAYNKTITPTNTMGAVAEMFRSWPGAIRSDHPARSFAAWGKHAEYLTKNHDLSDIFGETSPLAKFYKLDGKVLLIGVGYDKNTSLHLADVRAEYPGKHTCVEHSAVLENGRRVWKAYETLCVDGEDFTAIGATFEAARPVKKAPVGQTDPVLTELRLPGLLRSAERSCWKGPSLLLYNVRSGSLRWKGTVPEPCRPAAFLHLSEASRP